MPCLPCPLMHSDQVDGGLSESAAVAESAENAGFAIAAFAEFAAIRASGQKWLNRLSCLGQSPQPRQPAWAFTLHAFVPLPPILRGKSATAVHPRRRR
jgi:hypothetical protein